MGGSWRAKGGAIICTLSLVLGVFAAIPVLAETSESSNYQATDLEFGGSSGAGCSDEYCAETTLGQAIIGDSANDVMNARFYDDTDDEPRLEVIVASSSSNMGVLKTDKTATKTMALRIKSSYSAGYGVQIQGDPPRTGSHTLKTPQSPLPAKPGSESFGINAVANTVPEIGRNPIRSASDIDQTHTVAVQYRQPDRFMYRPGDAIISNSTGTGRVDYVVSMIVTISSDTPPGYYGGTLQAVVVPLV